MKEKRPRLVVSVLVEKDSKYLLIKEALEDGKEYWIIPGGGVDFGESLEQAALREIKEETGLEVTDLKYLAYKEAIFPDNNYHTVIFFFEGETKSEDVTLEDKILEAKFFTKEEFKDLNLVDSAKWLFKNLKLLQ